MDSAALRWSWEPTVVVPVAVAGALYARGAWRAVHEANARIQPAVWQVAAFAFGWLTLVAALVSPLDELSSQLFSAHMVQHELLMVVAAPLLVLGRPLRVMLRAFPSGWRRPIRRAPHRLGLGSAWAMLTGPAVVWVLHGAALWSWHVPGLYQAALSDDRVHALEHLCFFGTAWLFWWALVHGRYGRFGYGVSVVYVFTTALHSNLLGALLTMTPHVWYPAYADSVRTWGLTALEDQQLAGLIMWVPAGLTFTVLGLALFAAWLGESERRVAYTSSERLARGQRGDSLRSLGGGLSWRDYGSGDGGAGSVHVRGQREG